MKLWRWECYGFIPIISRSTGLNADESGFVLKDLSASVLENAVNKFSGFSEWNIKELSTRAKLDTLTNYTFSNI